MRRNGGIVGTSASPTHDFEQGSSAPDVPPAVGSSSNRVLPIRGSDQIVRLHTEWARVHADPAETPTPSAVGFTEESVRSIASSRCITVQITASWLVLRASR